MRTNYVPKHFQDHADSEYALYVRVDHKSVEFIGNKLTHLLSHTVSLHISTDLCSLKTGPM